MKVKVSEASGEVLDFVVSSVERRGLGGYHGELLQLRIRQGLHPPRFSSDWSEGGPIIERELIDLTCINGTEYMWMATVYVGGSKVQAYGGTSLEAAMRAFVIGKLGYEVDVPEELLT